jgi:hypothetical protein
MTWYVLVHGGPSCVRIDLSFQFLFSISIRDVCVHCCVDSAALFPVFIYSSEANPVRTEISHPLFDLIHRSPVHFPTIGKICKQLLNNLLRISLKISRKSRSSGSFPVSFILPVNFISATLTYNASRHDSPMLLSSPWPNPQVREREKRFVGWVSGPINVRFSWSANIFRPAPGEHRPLIRRNLYLRMMQLPL